MATLPVAGRFGVVWVVAEACPDHSAATPSPRQVGVAVRRPRAAVRRIHRSAVGRAIFWLLHLVARGLAVGGRLRQVDRRIGGALDYLFHREVGQLGVSPGGYEGGSGWDGLTLVYQRSRPSACGLRSSSGAGYRRRPRASSRNCSTVHPAWTIIAPIVLGGMSLLPCRGIETLLLPLRACVCLPPSLMVHPSVRNARSTSLRV